MNVAAAPASWAAYVGWALIAGRFFTGLIHPLAYNQGASLGFLMLGVNEYALRLIPLLAGIGSLFLFFAVAKRCLRPEGALAALALFAACDSLICYSSEVKQYSTDVFVCLYYRSDPAYEFYTRGERPPIGAAPVNIIHGMMGRDASGQCVTDLTQLRGRSRVWVVFFTSCSPEAF